MKETIDILDVWKMVCPNMELGYDQPYGIDHQALRERIQELVAAERHLKELQAECKVVRKFFCNHNY